MGGGIVEGLELERSEALLDRPRLSMIGTRALLFEAAGPFDMAQQRRIWALAGRAGEFGDLAEVVPGVMNLLFVFRSPPEVPGDIVGRLEDAWTGLSELHVEGRHFEIGVRYGGELGSDLLAVAAHAGLSPEVVVARHQAPVYAVCAIGSAPGSPYLHGLDPSIAMPRKKVPTLRMLAGTVTIGGMQAGISALTGPNGWNSIGFAEVALFDPNRARPALFAIGDRISFRSEGLDL